LPGIFGSVALGQLIAKHPLYARHVPNGIALNARPIAVVINSYQLPATSCTASNRPPYIAQRPSSTSHLQSPNATPLDLHRPSIVLTQPEIHAKARLRNPLI